MERHGYDIMQQVRADSGDAVKMPGTLYGLLDRVIGAGSYSTLSDACQLDKMVGQIFGFGDCGDVRSRYKHFIEKLGRCPKSRGWVSNIKSIPVQN
jgi:hypothetical protein